MIQSKAEKILPDWLRFMRGVVDSEDIPLNLSRELLQDSALIKKLSLALQRKILRFFQEQSRKDPEKYEKFFEGVWQLFQGGNGKCSRDRRERGDCKTVEIREFERESREDEISGGVCERYEGRSE